MHRHALPEPLPGIAVCPGKSIFRRHHNIGNGNNDAFVLLNNCSLHGSSPPTLPHHQEKKGPFRLCLPDDAQASGNQPLIKSKSKIGGYRKIKKPDQALRNQLRSADFPLRLSAGTGNIQSNLPEHQGMHKKLAPLNRLPAAGFLQYIKTPAVFFPGVPSVLVKRLFFRRQSHHFQRIADIVGVVIVTGYSGKFTAAYPVPRIKIPAHPGLPYPIGRLQALTFNNDIEDIAVIKLHESYCTTGQNQPVQNTYQ